MITGSQLANWVIMFNKAICVCYFFIFIFKFNKEFFIMFSITLLKLSKLFKNDFFILCHFCFTFCIEKKHYILSMDFFLNICFSGTIICHKYINQTFLIKLILKLKKGIYRCIKPKLFEYFFIYLSLY